MSDKSAARTSSGSRHRKHSESNKVLRAVTYVLTPFLVFTVVCGIIILALYAPYSKLQPYLKIVFNSSNTRSQGDSQVSIYHPDDVPTVFEDIKDDETEETHTSIYPYYGDYYGTFTCENAGMIDLPIYAGTAADVLKNGIGWYNGSVHIGKPGNVVLAGHNHTFFYNLPLCNIGDIVVIDTSFIKITYIIKDKVVFHQSDLQYVQQRDYGDRLTAYTCWNNGKLGMSEYRLAIICEPVETEWKEVEAAQ